MQLHSFRKYLVFFIVCATTIGHSQDTLTLKKGMIVDGLTIPSSENTFSIYLPKSFQMDKSWPLLLGFDSSGKASNLIRLYQAAAEECGYIVAVTNFSPGQEIKQKFGYARVFMNHILSLFPIQRGRVYTTGIHGDAQLASLFPVFFKKEVFGTIPIGDAYDYTKHGKINKNFAFIGMVDKKNHKYREMLENVSYLKRKAVPAYVLAYDGKAGLPGRDMIKKAFITFTLQAMLKGRIPKDSVWIDKQYQSGLLQVDSYVKGHKYLLAYGETKQLREKYRLLLDIEPLKEKQKEIKKSKGYRKERQRWNSYFQKESFLRETYSWFLEEDVQTEAYDNMGWWQYQITYLDSLVHNKDKYANNMGHRMKGYLKDLVNIQKEGLKEKKGDILEKKMFLAVLSTIIDKKDFEPYRTIISLSAQDQDYQTALFYLEKLLLSGYKDMDALYTIDGTLGLKLSKDYNALIKKHLGTAKYIF